VRTATKSVRRRRFFLGEEPGKGGNAPRWSGKDIKEVFGGGGLEDC
jgi:hypothetical protein